MKQFNNLFQQMQKSKLTFKFPVLCFSSRLYFLFPEVGEEQTFFILNATYTQAII